MHATKTFAHNLWHVLWYISAVFRPSGFFDDLLLSLKVCFKALLLKYLDIIAKATIEYYLVVSKIDALQVLLKLKLVEKYENTIWKTIWEEILKQKDVWIA